MIKTIELPTVQGGTVRVAERPYKSFMRLAKIHRFCNMVMTCTDSGVLIHYRTPTGYGEFILDAVKE